MTDPTQPPAPPHQPTSAPGSGGAPPPPPKGAGGPATIIIIVLIVVGGFGMIAVIGCMAGILLPSLGKARQSARMLKDSSQVRGVHQGLVSWANNNQDLYPIPGRIDGDGTTIAGATPDEKNITAHSFSLLVFNGFTPTEMFISPAEANPAIVEFAEYEFHEPSGTADPSRALWDPEFRATPRDVHATTAANAGKGNFSYAHTPYFLARKHLWSLTFNAREAVLGNRGPEYRGSPGSWNLVPGPTGDQSNSLLIHGSRVRWEGNIAYNDNHVEFETRPDPDGLTWTFSQMSPKTRNDNLFVSEHDAAGTPTIGVESFLQANMFLRHISQVTGKDQDISVSLWVD